MIRIANWLLTRRCNLRCEYCAIVQNYENKPEKYPDMRHYYVNEMKTEYVIKGLHKLHIHNPDMFHIFYGGEPLLRKDLYEIINYCNEKKIFNHSSESYTFSSTSKLYFSGYPPNSGTT